MERVTDRMTTARQSYDPYKLINEVTDILRASGVDAKTLPGHSGDALAGAGQLLRALGVEALMDPVDSFDRAGSRVWSEEDGLR